MPILHVIYVLLFYALPLSFALSIDDKVLIWTFWNSDIWIQLNNCTNARVERVVNEGSGTSCIQCNTCHGSDAVVGQGIREDIQRQTLGRWTKPADGQAVVLFLLRCGGDCKTQFGAASRADPCHHEESSHCPFYWIVYELERLNMIVVFQLEIHYL